MVVPLYVVKKVSHQLAHGSEFVGYFLCNPVAVVAFAGFVVVSQNTLTADNIGKPVFEVVMTSRQRHWQLPDYKFSERIRIDFYPLAHQLLRFHVGDFDNNLRRCQILQRNSLGDLASARTLPRCARWRSCRATILSHESSLNLIIKMLFYL
jgi:hypothetical protein